VNRRILEETGWPCPTGEEMRSIDREAIAERGIPGRVLMETAGRAVASAILERFDRLRRPLVICGGGNNGGDGYVIARVLREADDRIEPAVLAVGDVTKHSEEARANLDALSHLDVEVTQSRDVKDLEPLLARADLIVDAVLGVGLSRPVESRIAVLLSAVAEARLPLVAVDLPSGISSDTGAALGIELPADLIVTLGWPKLGLAVRPMEAEILVADIGLPGQSLALAAVRQHVLTDAAAARLLPERPEAGHKGSFGHVLVVGGSPGKTGAAVLAAEAAQRGGAGLVTVASSERLNEIFEVKLTEAMSLPLEYELEALLEAARARDASVVGPGMGTDEQTRGLIRALLGQLDRPAVVDADGLNAFAGDAAALRAPGPRILTPHPGEMSRLLNRSTAQVQADRVDAARELARRTEAVVVLKGARSLVAAPDGALYVNPTGGPGLASGGTGDVLSGLLGALLAQGLSPLHAAALGVFLHGRAGDECGRVGVLAGEVADRIPGVWRALDQLRSVDHEPGGLRRFP
jgi:hydroxyethylthiazole kinase-like uncharacterized protein yjeF